MSWRQTNTGPRGPRGSTGPKGDPGAKGDPGDPGPKGDPGDPGAKGDTGAAGPTGPRGADGPTGATGPAGADGASGGYLGAYAVPPAVEVGKEYYNTGDNRRYLGIASAQSVNSLSFTLTPAPVPSTPGVLQGSGFSVGRAVTYGATPFAGWNDLTLQVDTDAQGNTQYYLEVATTYRLFEGFSLQVGTVQFTFRRDSSTSGGGDIWTSNDVSAAPWALGVAVPCVAHCSNTPFTSTVNQWHWLPYAGEDNSYNALTDVSLTDDNQLRFSQHTGPDHDIDLTAYRQADWATDGNTDFIPAAKIELTQTLIDGTGIGITSAGGQSARGPLRLFSPAFDLDDPDKQHGIIYVRVNLTIVDADATTSFANDSVVRSITQTARIRASVMRQDDNEYAAGANQGERVGDAVTVYRGAVAVGTPSLWISRNSDKELGYFVDWSRASGASAIEFQLLNFSVEFTHNDVAAAGLAGLPDLTVTTDGLTANIALTPGSYHTIVDIPITASNAGVWLGFVGVSFSSTAADNEFEIQWVVVSSGGTLQVVGKIEADTGDNLTFPAQCGFVAGVVSGDTLRARARDWSVGTGSPVAQGNAGKTRTVWSAARIGR